MKKSLNSARGERIKLQQPKIPKGLEEQIVLEGFIADEEGDH